MKSEMKLIMENWNTFVAEGEALNEVDTDLKKLLAALEDNVEKMVPKGTKALPQNEVAGLATGALLFGIMTKGAAAGALIEYILKKMKSWVKEEYRLDPDVETNEEKSLEKMIKVIRAMKNSAATLGLHTIARFLLPKIGLFNSEEAKEKLDKITDIISLVIGIGGLFVAGYAATIKAATTGGTATQGVVSALSSAFDVSTNTADKVLEIFDNAANIKQAIIGCVKMLRLAVTGAT
jgi:hypothetical protein